MDHVCTRVPAPCTLRRFSPLPDHQAASSRGRAGPGTKEEPVHWHSLADLSYPKQLVNKIET